MLKIHFIVLSLTKIYAMYRRFPLTHGVIHGAFGAIECLNSQNALKLLSCQSHGDKCLEIHVFVCYFVL